MELEEGDIVLGTVDRIVGTVVFVKIKTQGKEIEGSLTFSEVAPGRIRNIRDYIVPKKIIVCKILRISQNGHIDLSLRRVTQKEAKEIKEKAKEEQSYEKIIRTVVKNQPEIAISKIKEEGSIYDFIQNSKENPKILEAIIGKEETKKILDIINSEKKKKSTIKKEIFLTSNSKNGLSNIKSILEDIKGIEIRYIAGGKYSLSKEGSDIKNIDTELKKIIEEIEKKAKLKEVLFSIKEK